MSWTGFFPGSVWGNERVFSFILKIPLNSPLKKGDFKAAFFPPFSQEVGMRDLLKFLEIYVCRTQPSLKTIAAP
jgi:hypothetical protein